MSEPSDKLPSTEPETDGPPAGVRTHSDKVRFAIAHHYGMGKDGRKRGREWISTQLGVSERQVSRYLNESDIGQEVQEVLAADEASWRLDMAVDLRKEIVRLEEIEKELLKRKKAVPAGFEHKTVRGTPTGDYNVKLADDTDKYSLQISVPTHYREVTDYGRDLQAVQAEKRQYWDQIADLLGLDAPSQKEVDHSLSERTEEVKIVEFRSDDDDYPEAEAETQDGEVIEVENIAETRQHPDDATDLSAVADDDDADTDGTDDAAGGIDDAE